MTLWGHQVHLCMHVICMYGVLSTKCLELAPPGLIALILYYFYFYLFFIFYLFVIFNFFLLFYF